jgi:hypothetical protein
VIAHDDVLARDTDDVVWLRQAGRRRWVVLMKDDRIRYRPGSNERSLSPELPASASTRPRG